MAINGLTGRDYHAVVGVGALRVHADQGLARVMDAEGAEVARLVTGDVVSIDGATGAVHLGSVPVERL